MDKDAQKRLINSARDLFYQKGYSGTSVREISRNANVTLALLHYYYRTKEAMFEIVFKDAFYKLFEELNTILTMDISVFDKIRQIAVSYIQVSIQNPKLPNFVFNESSTNPQIIMPLINKCLVEIDVNANFEKLSLEIENAIGENKMKHVDQYQLCFDILSLSLFPFMAKDCLVNMQTIDEETFKMVINQRGEHIAKLLIDSITL